MRVLYVHQHFTTPQGASGTRSFEFAKELIAQGHQVVMVCGEGYLRRAQISLRKGMFVSRGEVDGIELRVARAPYSNSFGLVTRTLTFAWFAVLASWFAIFGRCDVIVATSTPLTVVIPGVLGRLIRGRKFIFEVRDLWPELPRALGMRNPILLGAMGFLEWLGCRFCHGAIGLAPGIVEGIRKKSRKDLPIAMIPNSCDLDLFRPSEAQGGSVESPTEEFRAVFTGAHGIANGLDALLNAGEELLRRGEKRIRIVLIGEGKEKPRLQREATARGIGNCQFLEAVPKTELARRVGDAGCGLMILKNVPAFYDGTSPNKFFDYISAGIPVVCNYPGWMSSMITENEIGLACPPDDPSALADALQRLADDPGLVAEMGRRSRQFAESTFSRKVLADQFVRFIEGIVGPRRTRT